MIVGALLGLLVWAVILAAADDGSGRSLLWGRVIAVGTILTLVGGLLGAGFVALF